MTDLSPVDQIVSVLGVSTQRACACTSVEASTHVLCRETNARLEPAAEDG